MPYSKEQLNYFRMIHIVMTIFSSALRELFKEEWRRFYGSKWRDRKRDGERFFKNESFLNRRQNRKALKTIRYGDSSKFDNSVLFYCILYSDSVGAHLYGRNPCKYREIDRLRHLRNEVCHIAPKDEVEDSDFQSFCSETIACFRDLSLSTSELKAIAREESFVTDEVFRMKAELMREQLAVREYEQYFFKKLSTVKKDFNPRPYLEKMKDQGILSEREVENIKKQKKKEIKLAMLMDSVVYKGTEVVAAFLNLLSETDPEVASSFIDFLSPSRQMEETSDHSPEDIRRATVKYPQYYTLVMRTFTNDIYKRDWDKLNKRSAFFLRWFPDAATKLFVKVEVAYGYNIQGESGKAMGLLNDAIANAWEAGENCSRILARALARKSLKLVYEGKYSESRALAEEASMIVSTMESPEEQIVCHKRIADCLLYEDGSLHSKKEKLTPVWNTIIELCQRNQEGVPRTSYYLRFVFADKARLHLGFLKNGFDCCPSSISDLEEAERCVKRLEEPDLKTDSEDTYTDAFLLICKSKIAFDKSKVADVAEEVETWQKEALSLYDKAAAACTIAKNNGISFMLSSLTKYLCLYPVHTNKTCLIGQSLVKPDLIKHPVHTGFFPFSSYFNCSD